jgi:hypothetical protein
MKCIPMIDNNNILTYLHNICLAIIIYDINCVTKYNINKKFINNIIDIVPINSQMYKIINELFMDDKFIKFISCPKSGLQSLITINKKNKKIYISFRGTEPRTIDIIINIIMVRKYLDDDVYVHRGYYEQLTINNSLHKIIKIISNLIDKYSDFTIDITGHSSGAGLGVIFSYILINKIPLLKNKININMFACPKICNKKLFKILKKNGVGISSFIYKNDFASLLFPLYHDYYPKFLLIDSFYFYLSSKKDLDKLQNYINIHKTSISDHFSKNYLDSLINICSNL